MTDRFAECLSCHHDFQFHHQEPEPVCLFTGCECQRFRVPSMTQDEREISLLADMDGNRPPPQRMTKDMHSAILMAIYFVSDECRAASRRLTEQGFLTPAQVLATENLHEASAAFLAAHPEEHAAVLAEKT